MVIPGKLFLIMNNRGDKMFRLINGYTVAEINSYRAKLISECRRYACDAEDMGMEEMACYYDEEVATYKSLSLNNISRLMIYRGVKASA